MRDSKKALEEIKINKPESPAIEIMNFIESSVHRDFINELYARLEQLKDCYLDCTYEMFLETRGGIKALEMTLTLFESLLHNRRQNDRYFEEIEDEKDL